MKNKIIYQQIFNKISISIFSVLCCTIFTFQMQAQEKADTTNIYNTPTVHGPLFDIQEQSSTVSQSSAKGEDLLKLPGANISNSLFGLLPGLTVIQGAGEPGSDAACMTIRGLGSYNYPDLVVFVDGYQVDFSYFQYLSPSEIESVSIFKDAAALAPLGMRGAHGVLWVNTKKGTPGKPVVGIELQTSWQQPTTLSKPLSATEYAGLYNEAYSNDLGEYQEFYNIPGDITSNTDWYNRVLKNSTPFHRADVTVKGGSSTTKYFVLMGYMRNNGLYDVENNDTHSNAKFEQFNIRTNLDFELFKIFEGRVNIGGRTEDRSYPNFDGNSLWQNMARYPNIIYDPVNTDGSYPGTTTHPDNPYASVDALGINTMHDRTLMTNFDLKEKLDFILPGLYLNQGVSFSTWTRGTRNVTRNYARIIDGEPQTPDQNTNYEIYDDYGTNQWNRLQFKVGAGYAKTFDQSELTAAVTYLQNVYSIDANLNGAAGVNNDYAFQNIGGRIHYDWNSRYIAEFGFSVSGSDNYAEGNRFGFYPALSVGWNIFNEKYTANSPDINLLKVRASAGTTGNDAYNGGRYLYQKYYSSLGGGGFATGNGEPAWHGNLGLSYVPNPDIFAEKSTKYNLGIDARFFNSLDVTVDLFNDKHTGIVTPDHKLLDVFGATPPYSNIGEVTNRGFELSANYTARIGDLGISVGANVSYAKNKIDYMAEYNALSERSSQTGKSIGTMFGYEAIGFYDVTDFDTEGNLNANLPQPVFGAVMPGDIKYRDINNDTKIDEFDQVEIGNGFLPDLSYAGHFGFDYKGFDLEFLLQGISGRDVNLLNDARLKTVAFENNGNVYEMAKNRWAYYPEQGIDTRATASYPRLSLQGNNNNYQPSTQWVESADYLRVRYIEFGYSFAVNTIKAVGLSHARIYLNASNPFTLSSLMSDYDLDPEVLSGYPAMKSYTLGLSLKF
ncbi:MAG: SusC/RagA family TonB-linked outer membrane protein [Draconibacterium sp.]